MSAPASPAAGPSSPVARPRLRLVVVPSPGPDLDERRPVPLVLPGGGLPRRTPAPGPRLRTDLPTAAPDGDFGPVLTRRAELPAADGAGRRLVTLALEALAGRRPVSQLQGAVSPSVYAALASGRRPRWCSEGTAPLAVSSVRVCEPVDGVAEVSAVARRGGRAHAVAARLEGVDGRWRCTALQVG